MKRIFLILVIIITNACTSKLKNNTDPIAGYWTGEVVGLDAAGEELPSKDIGILIIPSCATGKICGKYSEDEYCPADIMLMEIDGNEYRFLYETAMGSKHACGKGSVISIDLELRSDGDLEFRNRTGDPYTGLLEKDP